MDAPDHNQLAGCTSPRPCMIGPDSLGILCSFRRAWTSTKCHRLLPRDNEHCRLPAVFHNANILTFLRTAPSPQYYRPPRPSLLTRKPSFIHKIDIMVATKAQQEPTNPNQQVAVFDPETCELRKIPWKRIEGKSYFGFPRVSEHAGN